MIEPLYFFNSRHEVVQRGITFPSGKSIVLNRTNNEYMTEDPEEIEFLSKLQYIGCRKMSDAEFRGYMTSKDEDLPRIGKKITCIEDIAQYMAPDALEKTIVSFLREKGYTIEKKKEDSIDGVLDAIEPLSNEYSDKKPTYPPITSIENLSWAELKKLAKDRDISTSGRKRELIIEDLLRS